MLQQQCREAVDEPLSGIQSGASVAVAIPDNTRPLPYAAILPALLEPLGEVASSVTVVIGNGLHREMTSEELKPVHAVCDRTGAHLVQHDASDESRLTHVDADVSGDRDAWPLLPATINRRLYDADRIISVGTVEPHQYAGFSGGAKGIAIGCGGEPTISAMHGLDFLRDTRTRLGVADDNPFQSALWELIDWTDAPLGLQLVPSTADGPTEIVGGPLRSTFEQAVETARNRFFEPLDQTYDWLVLDVPPEKATNFYQASRAATYAGLVDQPAIARGGTLFIRATCPEGIGQGSGEQACAKALRRGRQALIDELESDRPIQTRGGQQRAYVIAQTLDRFDVALVGADHHIDALDAVGIQQFDTLETAQNALNLGPNGRIIDDVFHGIPIAETAGR